MIIFFDTETTDLYPGQICQLTYLMQDRERISAKNFFFSVKEVMPGAQSVHGFSKEKLEELSLGKIFSDNIDEIERDFLSADLVVAHNLSFDGMFMRKEFERVGKIFKVKEDMCSMKESVSSCKLSRTNGRGYKYPKLSELCDFVGVSERDIILATKQFFNASTSFHDARFDATALCLAVNFGKEKINKFGEIVKYL